MNNDGTVACKEFLHLAALFFNLEDCSQDYDLNNAVKQTVNEIKSLRTNDEIFARIFWHDLLPECQQKTFEIA